MTAQCEWVGCYATLDEPDTYYCDRHATAEDDIYDRWKDQQIMDEYEKEQERREADGSLADGHLSE